MACGVLAGPAGSLAKWGKLQGAQPVRYEGRVVGSASCHPSGKAVLPQCYQ